MTNRFQKVPVGSVTVGGEIGQRLAISADKILHHLDLEGKFARHFKQRRSEPEVPGGFVGYGMLMDGIVKAAARSIGGENCGTLKDERIRFVELRPHPVQLVTALISFRLSPTRSASGTTTSRPT